MSKFLMNYQEKRETIEESLAYVWSSKSPNRKATFWKYKPLNQNTGKTRLINQNLVLIHSCEVIRDCCVIIFRIYV